ncbi:MAG: AAA family ATPase [Bacteroidaceae bacterium]|nr:AAA family ATPase [Bacteroidaceae bacterium]
MVIDYLKEQIEVNFGHLPTQDQHQAIDLLAQFILSPETNRVFLLKGFAGTGKTSLLAAVVRTLEQLERPCVLMAPTGRAAKVFSLYADHPAYTIHKRIYRQKSIDEDSIFTLNFNMLHRVFFIVDEASMIGRTHPQPSSRGGSGNFSSEYNSLLDDLITFVYGSNYAPPLGGEGGGSACRLILVGDTAQLPPVGEVESPALQAEVLRSYGLDVMQTTLRQIVRQQEKSGILWNATVLRRLIDTEQVFDLPKIRFFKFNDVVNVPGDELIEMLSNCYSRYGQDETMVVCRSNKRAIVYNNGIRNQILGREEELSTQDLVMIAKNNYYWTAPSPQGEESNQSSVSFLANGDIAVVQRIHNQRELYGFHFADCILRLPDYDDYEVETTVLLDTLHAEAPALTHEQQERLFQRVMEDYMDIPLKRDRLKKMKEDPYFNALQIKYAYAVTCHKAQGGQWGHIFIDQGYMTDDMFGPDYFRWLYTALTRATDTVYFVNWREVQTMHDGG